MPDAMPEGPARPVAAPGPGAEAGGRQWEHSVSTLSESRRVVERPTDGVLLLSC